MLIYKCDACKKPIADRGTALTIITGYHSFELCKKCGVAVWRVLRKWKLIK